jgi:hypothetical protein
MMQMRLLTLSALLLFASLGNAFAEDHSDLKGLLEKGPQALLEATDKNHNAFEDQTIRVRMEIQGGAGDGTILETTTHTKGVSRRAIRMHAPANLKGMGVVVKSRDEIYVRLPDSRKVRRVGSHAKRQTFMGTTWNFDDMSMIWLAPDFSATLASETPTHIVLDLARKEGVDLQYKKVTIHVDRTHILVDKLIYFNEAGDHVKTQSRRDLKIGESGSKTYQDVSMDDEKGGFSTRTRVLSEEVNSGLSNRIFGRRWLSRGP